MPPAYKSLILLLGIAIVLFVPVRSLQAVIVYDDAATSNTANTTDPEFLTAAGISLWDYVAQVRTSDGLTADASAVYLGNGYLLTANHVSGTRYFIQGVEYLADTSFGAQGSQTILNSSSAGLDMKAIKLLGAPELPLLRMSTASDTTTSQVSLFIGWGVGKGTAVSNQGWQWGSNATSAERWGLNATGASALTENGNPNSYLSTTFYRSLFVDPANNADVFGLSLGDSGGGLFQFRNNDWELAGIAAAVSFGGRSFFDSDLGTAGDQPDASYFVDLQVHSQDVVRTVADIQIVPESSSLAMMLMGGSTLLLLGGRPKAPSLSRLRSK